MREIFITHPFSRFAMILFSLAYIVLQPVSAQADGPQPLMGGMKQAGSTKSTWTIEADKLTYDQEKQVYEADGNVKISAKDRLIEADHASVNNQTRMTDLRGRVTVQYGRNWIKGEHVTWNLDSETGWVDIGILFFAENNFFIQGESIAKLGPTEFELKKGFITSCNPADPDWKIQFNQMTVTVGGTAWTRDASFWARSTPVAYWPLFGMPVENERQSGFLIPWAGETTLNGYETELPYYWAIRDDMDATFYAHYMENRGVMGGIEYRIDNPEWGRGIFMFNYLHDQASPSTLADDGFPFVTQNRFWLRGDYDVTLPWNIQAKVDLDFISDRNFLNEFTQGSSAFYTTDSIFRQYFGQGLLYDQTSLVRESSIYLEKKDESDLLSLDVRYWQNLQGGQDVTTAQKLPALSYTIVPKWIDGTPFYYTLDSSAVNYWSPQDTTEQRLDVYPRVYYPLHWGNYLDIDSSAGFRNDSYAIQWQNVTLNNFTERAQPGAKSVGPLMNPYAFQFQNLTLNENDFTERTVPDAKVEMSSRVNKEYQVDFMDLKAVQHAIQPEISYEYATQSTFGNQTPLIDRLDQDQARDGIRYGFTTFLTGKEVAKDANGNPILDADGNPTTIYRELVRFRVFQFFNVEPPSVPEPIFITQNVMRQGLSPVGFRMDITPIKYFSISYNVDVDWNSAGQGGAQSLFMGIDSGKGQVISISYQDIPALAVNEAGLVTNLKVYKDVYVSTWHDYSLDAGIMFLQGYGVRYIRGCWGVGAGYEKQGIDNRFVFTLDLLGLGSLGQQTSFFFRPQFGETLPGYQRAEAWMLTH
ncbi:MAG: putative LPS assembly protein LptD [Syntrophobacteraceae bacterium]